MSAETRRVKGLVVMAPEWLDLVYGPDELAELARSVDFVAPPQSAHSLHAQLERLREVEVIFTGWGAPVMDAGLLAAAPRLRAVFHAGGSIRYFTTEAFWSRAIVVTTATAANAVAVVDYALATILFSLRQGWYHARFAHQRGAFPPTRPMAGGYASTVGLISLGMVGRQLAARLRSFEFETIVYDPWVSAGEADALGVRLVDLPTLFAECDVVSLHAPWLKETEGMITGAHFAAMKPHATFLNTARGALVREDEMIAVLRERPDLTAVLDVTFPEPPVPGSPLFSLSNVILTPHIAGTQGRECRRLSRCMLDEFQRWRTGGPLRYALNRDEAARRA